MDFILQVIASARKIHAHASMSVFAIRDIIIAAELIFIITAGVIQHGLRFVSDDVIIALCPGIISYPGFFRSI